MLKNNKGITLTSLAIMIIILLILASIATYSGVSTISYVKYTRAKAQIEAMQAQVDSWYQELNNGNTEIADYGTTIVVSNYSSAFAAAGSTTSNISGYKLFTGDYIESLGIDGINYDFLINIEIRRIILANGITYQDETYYTPEDFGYSVVNSNSY